MSKSMETNTAAIYLRKSTEDDGNRVAVQQRVLLITSTSRGNKQRLRGTLTILKGHLD